MSTYLESDAVKAAKEQTQAHQAKRPSYTSRWESHLQQTLQQLDGRKFTYDAGTDPLYDSYRRAYTRKGKLAMEDTLGKTTALTGGYGNSYAQTAAQESYEDYMQQLTDKIPQLYALAQERYDAETKALNDRYEQYLQLEENDRERFDGAFERWMAELKLLQDNQQALEKQDYDRFEAQRQWQAQQDQAAYEQMDNDRKWQAQQDQAAYDRMDNDRKWQAQLDKQEAAAGSGNTGNTDNSGSAGTATGTAGKGYDNGSVSEADIKKIQLALGVTPDGKWGPESRKAAGDVDADTAWRNYLSEFGG